MRFDMRGVDHLRVSGPPAPSKRPKKVFPNAAPRPAYKAIIDRRRGAIFGRAITPAAAALKHMHDAADHAAIIYALDASYIPRQVKFDPLPLLIAQPKQIFAHDPNPLPKTNQDRIVRAQKLMSFHPSTTLADLLTPLLVANPFSAMRAPLLWWLGDKFEDGLTHGGQCRLRWRPIDSFFPVLLF